METRSQLTSKDLVLHWNDQTLHEGNHKIVNKENISSGERQKGGIHNTPRIVHILVLIQIS